MDDRLLAPNTLIHDRYLIVRQIGQGGMGAIYEAIDQRLGNRVALKQTLVGGAQLDKAFEREAKLLASLHHPALPVVSDYFSDAGGQFLVEIYAVDASGTGMANLSNNPANDYDPAWSPDGRQIAFMSTRTNQNGSIYLMNADGTDQKPVAGNDASDSSPAWSPDGRWLAFASLRDARLGIYVMDVSGGGQVAVVNDAKDNFSPSWRR